MALWPHLAGTPQIELLVRRLHPAETPGAAGESDLQGPEGARADRI